MAAGAPLPPPVNQDNNALPKEPTEPAAAGRGVAVLTTAVAAAGAEVTVGTTTAAVATAAAAGMVDAAAGTGVEVTDTLTLRLPESIDAAGGETTAAPLDEPPALFPPVTGRSAFSDPSGNEPRPGAGSKPATSPSSSEPDRPRTEEIAAVLSGTYSESAGAVTVAALPPRAPGRAARVGPFAEVLFEGRDDDEESDESEESDERVAPSDPRLSA